MKKIFRFLAAQLSKRNLFIIKSLPYLKRAKRLNLQRLDYVRLSSLELVAHEIYSKNLNGAVAELGVYKGDFAKEINTVFADRKLYLFDTFEGFDKSDISTEVKNGFSSGEQDFSDTSAECVLAKMPHKSQCEIKKGFFPNTANGLEEKFVFVSIDTDLFDPIYSGLNYFYPRLEKGGYIFIHDFNNDEYKGAREAVIRFCKENSLPYFPIADIGGTVVLSK
jgi:O-methyltransferase